VRRDGRMRRLQPGFPMILLTKVNKEAVGLVIDKVMEVPQDIEIADRRVNSRGLLREGCFSGIALIENNPVKLLNLENI